MERSPVLEFSTIDVAEISPQQIRAAVAILIAIGTLYCFLGYRTLKFVIGLTGFLFAGGVAGAYAGWATGGSLLAAMITAVIAGVIGAIAVFFFYRVGVFLLGLLGGAVIARAALGGQSDVAASSIVLATAVFGGLTGLFLERPLMTIATSAIGAWMVINGIAFFVLGNGSVESFETALSKGSTQYMLLIYWLVLTVAGALTQFVTHKPKEQT